MLPVSQSSYPVRPVIYANQPPDVVKAPALASYTTDQAARQLLRTSHERGFKWQDRNRDGVVDIAYEFFTPDNPHAVSHVPKGASELSEHQKKLARMSMQAWADVARITFSENSASTEGRLTLGLYAGDGESYASLPYPRDVKKVARHGWTKGMRNPARTATTVRSWHMKLVIRWAWITQGTTANNPPRAIICRTLKPTA